VGKEAEVTDTNEALGEQMQEEAAQELIERQSHQFLLIVVRRIAPWPSASDTSRWLEMATRWV
jgi:hypothetical protein